MTKRRCVEELSPMINGRTQADLHTEVAHVYEREREFSFSLKNVMTSLKTNENLDTCTRTIKIWPR